MTNCICIDVDEECRVHMLVEKTRRARTEHRCGECDETIAPGDLYLLECGTLEREFFTYKTCARCANVRAEYFPCGWYWGELRRDFKDAHGFDYTKGIPADFAPCGRRQA